MKKDFLIDYISCILFRALGSLLRKLPIGCTLFLGRRVGDLLYYFDCKHKAIAYANLKSAFGHLSPLELRRLTHGFYQNLGQSIMEIFLIPRIDKKYFDTYIQFEGREHIDEALAKKKGVILLGVHAGSWELSNVICATLGFTFNVFVRDQRLPRMDRLLNEYRTQKGCKIIQRQNQTRQLLEALKNNEAIGMTIDQGGKDGALVTFFEKSASMATGAVRIALKYDAVILPAYYTRVKGPYIKTIIGAPFTLKNTGDLALDIQENTQGLIDIFARYVEQYPKDYLWTYKVWKYSKERRAIILSDTKAGHLRQSQAVAKMLASILEEQGIRLGVDVVEVAYRNRVSKNLLLVSSVFSGKYSCQGCNVCLRSFVTKDSNFALQSSKADYIISCGSSLAAANYILSREHLAKSIVIQRPSFLPFHKFDFVVMPRHDKPRKRKNVVAVDGALTLIDEAYLDSQAKGLLKATIPLIHKNNHERDEFRSAGDRNSGLKLPTANCELRTPNLSIGLLIGGDSKGFCLAPALISVVVEQIKEAAEKLNAFVYVTTSRRTSSQVESLLKRELHGFQRCKLLIVANEKNIPEAVGGILGVSDMVIVSPESISMVSEAISSRKWVLVFNAPGLGKKHKRFLAYCADKRYIYAVNSSCVASAIEDILRDKPAITQTQDNYFLGEALKKII